MVKKRLSAAVAAVLLLTSSYSTAFAQNADIPSPDAVVSDSAADSSSVQDSSVLDSSSLDSSSVADSSALDSSTVDSSSAAPVLKDISTAKIVPIPDQKYTGSELKPSVMLTLDDVVLKEGTDFILEYKDNVEAGTASVTAKGIGEYTGQVSASFNIIKEKEIGAVKTLRAAKVGEKNVTLKWSRAKNAEHYQVRIYRANIKKYELVAKTPSTSYTLKNLKPGQKFTIRIIPCTNDGRQGDKTTYKNCRFTTKPAAVKNLRCTANVKGAVTLTWSKVANANRYQIYYSTEKHGKYRLLKDVNKSKTTVKTGLMPTGKKVYYKVRAVSKIDGQTQYGKCSNVIKKLTFNKKSIKQVIAEYSNSKSVKTVNAQGFKLSDGQRSRLGSAMTCVGGDAGYIMYDIDSGAAVAYNANTYFETASTVKMPYCLYCFREMDKGKANLDTMLTYQPYDYNDGSSWLKTQPFGGQYSIRRVIELIGQYSDNCGYYMMQDKFGFDGYNRFIESLGCKPTISRGGNRWGWVCASDSAKEWNCMWNYMNNGKYRDFARKVFSTTCAANFRSQLGNRYTVYEKSGWTDYWYNDTCLVNAKHPYIIICLSNRTDAQRMRNVAEISESIHNDMWRYFES